MQAQAQSALKGQAAYKAYGKDRGRQLTNRGKDVYLFPHW